MLLLWIYLKPLRLNCVASPAAHIMRLPSGRYLFPSRCCMRVAQFRFSSRTSVHPYIMLSRPQSMYHMLSLSCRHRTQYCVTEEDGLNCLRCWWSVTQRTVWSDLFFFFSPFFNQYFYLRLSIEYFSIEHLIPELAIETLDINILPHRPDVLREGLPGSIYKVFTPNSFNHFRTCFAENSERLFDRM